MTARRSAAVSVLELVALVLWLGLLGSAVPTARADSLDEQTRQIARQLRCPICESVSVADSPAELAVQMRGLIRKKLEAGDSEQQIIASFVEAYGDSVLLEPPRRGLGWIFWLAPVAAVLIGGLLLALVVRGWAERGSKREPLEPIAERLDQSAADQARRELEAARRGLAP